MEAEDWVTENITEYYTKEELQRMLDNGRLKDLFITAFKAGEHYSSLKAGIAFTLYMIFFKN